VFYGLRPASTGLIIAAGLGVAKIALLHLDQYEITKNIASLLNYKAIILALVIYLVMKKKDFHPILMVVAAAIVGIVFQF
jgi:chromate transporter